MNRCEEDDEVVLKEREIVRYIYIYIEMHMIEKDRECIQPVWTSGERWRTASRLFERRARERAGEGRRREV